MENLLVPYQAETTISSTQVLVFAPHPDDEVFGCGGAIMRHVEHNIPVCVIVVSDGAHGVNAENVARYILQRQNESIAAANILGYGGPVFWSYRDRGVRYGEKLVQQLVVAIKEIQADLIYAPSIMEMHPDHRALGMAAVEAVRRIGSKVSLALYEVGIPLNPNCLLDISELMQRKQAAMACFVSQLKKQRYDLDIAALNRYRTYTLPATVTAAEAYRMVSAEELTKDPFKLYQSEYARQKILGLTLDSRDMPLVSVIIRSMDRTTLSDALNSVALQTYSNIEVIVVNAKGSGHHKIDENCGLFPMRMAGSGEPLLRSRAANIGLQAAKGAYLIFLDDDDWFEPHHIAALKQKFDQTENIIAVYSAIRCIDKTGKEIKRFEEDFDPTQFRINNFIPIHAVLFRRLAIDSGASFDETLPVCEDWDFWLQVLSYGNFQYISEIGATYQMQNETGSNVWDDPRETQKLMLIIYRKWMPKWDDKALWSIMEYARYKRLFVDNNQFMNSHITKLNNLITERDSRIIELDKKVAESGERIAEFLSSTSWRITQPLRKIRSLCRNLRLPG